MAFADALNTVLRGQDLSADQAAAAMADIVEGVAPPAQVAGLLVGLAIKGERPAEIVGFARQMRERATPVAGAPRDCVDLCGTGGDHAGTFNISSAAAIIVAACGVPVAKHGNRSVSSQCGSADVYEALGVQVAASPAVVSTCLREAGIAFLFAPTFHPSMRQVGAIRRELGVRTAFNLLGPLTNPVRPRWQLVGVPRPELTELIARSLGLLGVERAWVVHGADGLDEISTTGYTKVSEYHAEAVRTFYIHPADVGLVKATAQRLKGGTATENAAILRSVLAGESGATRDVVLLNAAAALLVCGRAADLKDGVARAASAVASGGARAVLDRFVACSTAGGGH